MAGNSVNKEVEIKGEEGDGSDSVSYDESPTNWSSVGISEKDRSSDSTGNFLGFVSDLLGFVLFLFICQFGATLCFC